MAEARAAVRLGHEHAGKAHLGHLAPQAAVEAGRVARITQPAQLGDRGFGREKGIGRVAHHRLVVGQY